MKHTVVLGDNIEGILKEIKDECKFEGISVNVSTIIAAAIRALYHEGEATYCHGIKYEIWKYGSPKKKKARNEYQVQK